MISKREAAQRLLARWLDEVASGEATLPLREFITAGQVDAVIAFDLLPDYSPACRARDFAACALGSGHERAGCISPRSPISLR
jgi:hypothetical protein